MYGMIFDFLREYVIERHGGKETWKALLDDNDYGYKIYFPVKEYPDEEIVALATSASKALNLPLPDVLEDFGSFVGPKLTTFYHMYVKDKSWKTLDIIEIAGSSIHDTIHQHNPSRKPPTLSSKRESDDYLILTYHSHRKLCPVVRGIVRGLGEKYGERFRIEESQCMHKGAEECVMHITRI
ncbi:MAG: heme NO-binding domain-containing protein [Sedimenticola sp.]